MKRRHVFLAATAMLVAGCPAIFPGAFSGPTATMVPATRDSAAAALAGQFGPVAGRWRLKLFDRQLTKDFVFEADMAGRHLSGRFGPLNEDAPPRWTVEGLLASQGPATLSFTIGSTTSVESATGTITVVANLHYGEYGLASPVPSPEPTPTPVPTPVTSGGVTTMPVPAPYPYGPPGYGFTAYTFVGTWSEAQASGSATAIRMPKPAQ